MNTFKWLKVINPLIGLSFLVQAGTGIALMLGLGVEWVGLTHVINGVIFVILGLLHLVLNWGWMKANFFKKKANVEKVVLFLLVIALLLPVRSYAQDAGPELFRQAIEQLKSGNYDGAISIFKGMLQDKKYSQNPEVHFHLGMAYYNSGRYDQALEQFTITQGLGGGKSMSYYFSGLIYEAKALQAGDAYKTMDLKKKALDSWITFLRYADPERKERIEVARKHIDMLKEDLNEK